MVARPHHLLEAPSGLRAQVESVASDDVAALNAPLDRVAVVEGVAGQLALLPRMHAFGLWLEEQVGSVSAGISYFLRRAGGTYTLAPPPPGVERLARLAVRHGRTVVAGPLADATDDGLARRGTVPSRSAGTVAAIPFHVSADGVPGALVAATRGVDGFRRRDLRLLAHAGRQVALSLSALRDLAAARALAQQLCTANEGLQALSQLSADFLGVVAHELRAPVAGVSARAWMLDEYWPRLSEEQRRQSVQAIGRRAWSMERLLDGLLTFSRLEAGQSIEVAPQATDLGPIVRRVVETLVEEHPGRVVDMMLPLDVPLALADAGRVEQVLVNLIHNALKFSTGPVQVRAGAQRAEVVVQVVDHGPGIASADLPRLFQKFVRLRAPDGLRRPGTGIGLFLSKAIVDAHGGRLWVESRPGPGAGSTFSMALPRADCCSSHIAPAAAGRQLRRSADGVHPDHR
ncbi:MAG: sensor histidine kinase [Chloroflexota bacterium]